MGNFTVFPNGINSREAWFGGGAAGDHTVDSSFGVAVGDVVQQVVALWVDADGTFSTALDLTSEFTSPVAAANTLSNAAGTATTDALVHVIFADQNPNA